MLKNTSNQVPKISIQDYSSYNNDYNTLYIDSDEKKTSSSSSISLSPKGNNISNNNYLPRPFEPNSNNNNYTFSRISSFDLANANEGKFSDILFVNGNNNSIPKCYENHFTNDISVPDFSLGLTSNKISTNNSSSRQNSNDSSVIIGRFEKRKKSLARQFFNSINTNTNNNSINKNDRSSSIGSKSSISSNDSFYSSDNNNIDISPPCLSNPIYNQKTNNLLFRTNSSLSLLPQIKNIKRVENRKITPECEKKRNAIKTLFKKRIVIPKTINCVQHIADLLSQFENNINDNLFNVILSEEEHINTNISNFDSLLHDVYYYKAQIVQFQDKLDSYYLPEITKEFDPTKPSSFINKFKRKIRFSSYQLSVLEQRLKASQEHLKKQKLKVRTFYKLLRFKQSCIEQNQERSFWEQELVQMFSDVITFFIVCYIIYRLIRYIIF